MSTHKLCFEQKQGNITDFQLKISFPRALTISVILHKNVIQMEYRSQSLPEYVFTQAIRIEVLMNNNVFARNTYGPLISSMTLCFAAYQNSNEGYICFSPHSLKGHSLSAP